MENEAPILQLRFQEIGGFLVMLVIVGSTAWAAFRKQANVIATQLTQPSRGDDSGDSETIRTKLNRIAHDLSGVHDAVKSLDRRLVVTEEGIHGHLSLQDKRADLQDGRIDRAEARIEKVATKVGL